MTIVLDYTLMFVSQFPLLIKVHQSLCSCYHLKPSPYMAETQMPPKIVKNHQHHPIRHPVILKLHQNPPVLHQFSSIFIMFHDFSSCFDPFFHHFSPIFSPGTATPFPVFWPRGCRAPSASRSCCRRGPCGATDAWPRSPGPRVATLSLGLLMMIKWLVGFNGFSTGSQWDYYYQYIWKITATNHHY